MADLVAEVRGKLNRLRSGIRWMFVAHGMARVLLVMALLLIWHYLTDTFLHVPLTVRGMMLGLMALIIIFVFVRRVVYPLTRHISEEALALMVEAEYPLLNDRLITSLQLLKNQDRYRGVASPQMMESVINEGLSIASKLKFREVVQSGRLLLATGFAAAAMSGLLVLWLSSPDTSKLWAKRLLMQDVDYPRQVTLDVFFPTDLERFPTNDVIDLNHTYDMNTREVKVARNSGLRVVAVVKNGSPDEAYIRFVPDRGDAQEQKMNVKWEDTPQGRKAAYFEYNVPAVLGNQNVFVSAGDAEEGPFRVTAVPAPELARDTEMTYTFPAYMQREPSVQTQSRNLVAPEKTSVRIEFGSEQPLAADGARLRFHVSGADPHNYTAVPLDGSLTRFAVDGIQLDSTLTEYEFLLVGADGLRNTTKYRYAVQVQEDRPPEVTLDFYGKGLEDESRVPVTLRGRLPLRYTVKDTYGVARRRMLYRYSSMGEDIWHDLPAFGAVYEQRDASMRRVIETTDNLYKKLTATVGDLRGSKAFSAKDFAANLSGLGRAIDGQVQAFIKGYLPEAGQAAAVPTPISSALERAQRDMTGAWRSFYQTYLESLTAAKLESIPAAELAQSMEQVAGELAVVLKNARTYLIMSQTDAAEQYVVPIDKLVEGTEFGTEDKLVQAVQMNGNQPIVIELRLEAEDLNFRQDSAQPILRGGVGVSTTAYLELMPVTELESRISRYIRSTLKEDLHRIITLQGGLFAEMKDFKEKQRSLVFGDDPEGRASREIMTRDQTLQAQAPDQALRLAERFANVAQTYVFNDIEFNDPEKQQENRIQAVRVVLKLLTVGIDSGNAMRLNVQLARAAKEDDQRLKAVEALLKELGLLDDFTGVRESFDRMRFARLLSTRKYEEPATLQRLDLLYSNITRGEAASEQRRGDLEAIIAAQEQTLAGLEIVRDRIGQWESFDALREEWSKLTIEQRELWKKIIEAGD